MSYERVRETANMARGQRSEQLLSPLTFAVTTDLAQHCSKTTETFSYLNPIFFP